MAAQTEELKRHKNKGREFFKNGAEVKQAKTLSAEKNDNHRNVGAGVMLAELKQMCVNPVNGCTFMNFLLTCAAFGSREARAPGQS